MYVQYNAYNNFLNYIKMFKKKDLFEMIKLYNYDRNTIFFTLFPNLSIFLCNKTRLKYFYCPPFLLRELQDHIS